MATKRKPAPRAAKKPNRMRGEPPASWSVLAQGLREAVSAADKFESGPAGQQRAIPESVGDTVILRHKSLFSNDQIAAELSAPATVLPTDAQARKDIPIGRGFFDYFPAAIAEVARVSKAGNDQHNPGQDINWARGKSTDQIDTALRHLLERGGFDVDGQRHTAKAAWRVMALLQLEMEAAGAPKARGAK